MKKNILILFILIGTNIFGQNELPLKPIQNFYSVCKSDNYSNYLKLTKSVQILETNQFSRSIRILEEVLEKKPNLCDAYYIQGFCYQNLKDYTK